MSWWTETRDSVLQEVGLGSPEAVANTVTREAKAAIGGNDVKKEIPQAMTNPFQAAATAVGSLSTFQLAGISLPVLALLAGGAYFIFLKKR